MSTSVIKRMVVVASVGWLAACGGGGGGADADASVSYNVATVRATAFQNQQQDVNALRGPSVEIVATVAGELSGRVFVVVAATGTGFSGSPVAVEHQGSGVYVATLQPNVALAPGSYSGRLELRLCRDAACAQEYAVDGASLPYQVTILPQLEATVLVNGTRVGSVKSGRGELPVAVDDGSTIEIRTNTPVSILYSSGPGFVTATVDPASTSTAWKAVVALDDRPSTRDIQFLAAPQDATRTIQQTANVNVTVSRGQD
jgi:hypothetical protein